MRACISGNRVLALKLYNRNPKALAMINAKGENCLNIAKSYGHPVIATVLECLEAARLLESKNSSYLSITPQDIEAQEEDVKFVKPYEILSKKIRTKSLDEYRLSPSITSATGRCRMKLRQGEIFSIISKNLLLDCIFISKNSITQNYFVVFQKGKCFSAQWEGNL